MQAPSIYIEGKREYITAYASASCYASAVDGRSRSRSRTPMKALTAHSVHAIIETVQAGTRFIHIVTDRRYKND